MAPSPESSPSSDDSPPSSSSNNNSPPQDEASGGGGDQSPPQDGNSSGGGDQSPPQDEVSSPPPPPPPPVKDSTDLPDNFNNASPPNSGDDNNDGNNKKSKHFPNSSQNSNSDGGSKHNLRPASLPADDTPPPSSNSSSNNTAVTVGLLVGLGVLIIVILAIIIVCVNKKKKRKQPQQQQPVRYYNNSDPKANQAQYNQNWYNSGQQSMTGSSGAMPPQGGWQMPPPPPMMSGDMSGTYLSGPAGPPVPPPHPGLALGFTKSTFTYDELAAATQGFSQANLLGQGGFGFVHKGVLPNGKEIAVKSLKSGSGQGEREFQAEVEIISRVHHRHLVSLVGYCIAGGQRMLVYEFVPNKTLEFHLHGRGRPVMDFETRLKIALGSAKGLAYLHEDCNHRIIHRDIKTANILIDDAFEAKVADFGLAKLSSDNYTHVSTRVMGTFGYLAPEYAASGKLTDKSDVFSFGVMLLELITGRRPIDPSAEEDSLVDWARPQLMRVLDEGVFEGLVDPRLENKFNPHEMTRMIACGAAAIRHSAKRRPKMSQIVRALEGDMSLDALNGGEGVRPGQSTYFGTGGGDYDANSYQQDMKKFMMTLNDEDYASSEYASSNEYGRPGAGFGGESSAMRARK